MNTMLYSINEEYFQVNKNKRRGEFERLRTLAKRTRVECFIQLPDRGQTYKGRQR